VSLSITAIANPYEQLLVRGTVVEVRDDNDLRVLDMLSEAYIGMPFPRRRWSTRVVLVVSPTIARYYCSSLRDPRFPVA
jgi:hypothetical protein